MSAASELEIFANAVDDDAPLLARKQSVVTQRVFSQAWQRFSEDLGPAPLGINVCADRGAFMVAFCAVLARHGTTLLPSDTLPATLTRVREHWPGAQTIVDRGGGVQRAVNEALVCDVAALIAGDAAEGRGTSSARARPVSERIAADHVAAVPFTSGSTGVPRPQPKRWGAMHYVAAMTNARLFADLPRYSVVATVPSQHMYGLEMTLMLALQGRALIAADRPLMPADIAAALHRLPQPRVLVTTPVHLRALVRSGQPLPAIALIVSATAPLSTTLAAHTEARLRAEVHEIYGCTEAGALATRRTVDGDVWQLFDGIRIGSVPGEDEGVVQGPHLLAPVPLPDRIACVDGQRFRLLGRRGDLINVAGKRASLAELNQKLLEVTGVLDGVIFAPADDPDRDAAAGGGNVEIGRLRGLVVTDGRGEGEVLRELARRVDAVFLPRPFYKVDAIERTATGKIPRAVLTGACRADD